MNSHDSQPVYDMNLLLQSLRACLKNDQYDFWAVLADDHQIKPLVTSVDALRTEFLCHIFSGGCVSSGARGCKGIVNMEEWSQSMGIRVIDSTLQWVEEGSLSVEDFVTLCKSLGLESTAKNKKILLTRKLAVR